MQPNLGVVRRRFVEAHVTTKPDSEARSFAALLRPSFTLYIIPSLPILSSVSTHSDDGLHLYDLLHWLSRWRSAGVTKVMETDIHIALPRLRSDTGPWLASIIVQLPSIARRDLAHTETANKCCYRDSGHAACVH